jgi:hypothetical protein
MGYKLLGFVVWQVGKRYAKRRFHGARRKIAVATVAAVVVGGVVAAQRQQASQ